VTLTEWLTATYGGTFPNLDADYPGLVSRAIATLVGAVPPAGQGENVPLSGPPAGQ
jgi:hypothetical protein